MKYLQKYKGLLYAIVLLLPLSGMSQRLVFSYSFGGCSGSGLYGNIFSGAAESRLANLADYFQTTTPSSKEECESWAAELRSIFKNDYPNCNIQINAQCVGFGGSSESSPVESILGVNYGNSYNSTNPANDVMDWTLDNEELIKRLFGVTESNDVDEDNVSFMDDYIYGNKPFKSLNAFDNEWESEDLRPVQIDNMVKLETTHEHFNDHSDEVWFDWAENLIRTSRSVYKDIRDSKLFLKKIEDLGKFRSGITKTLGTAKKLGTVAKGAALLESVLFEFTLDYCMETGKAYYRVIANKGDYMTPGDILRNTIEKSSLNLIMEAISDKISDKMFKKAAVAIKSKDISMHSAGLYWRMQGLSKEISTIVNIEKFGDKTIETLKK